MITSLRFGFIFLIAQLLSGSVESSLFFHTRASLIDAMQQEMCVYCNDLRGPDSHSNKRFPSAYLLLQYIRSLIIIFYYQTSDATFTIVVHPTAFHHLTYILSVVSPLYKKSHVKWYFIKINNHSALATATTNIFFFYILTLHHFCYSLTPHAR